MQGIIFGTIYYFYSFQFGTAQVSFWYCSKCCLRILVPNLVLLTTKLSIGLNARDRVQYLVVQCKDTLKNPKLLLFYSTKFGMLSTIFGSTYCVIVPNLVL